MKTLKNYNRKVINIGFHNSEDFFTSNYFMKKLNTQTVEENV